MWHGFRLSLLVTVDDDDDCDKGGFEVRGRNVEFEAGNAATAAAETCDTGSVDRCVILVDRGVMFSIVNDVARPRVASPTSWLSSCLYSSPYSPRDRAVIVMTVLVAQALVYVVVFIDASRRQRDLGDDGLSVDRNGLIWIVVVLPAAAAGKSEAVGDGSSDDASGLVKEIFLTEAISSPLTVLMLH